MATLADVRVDDVLGGRNSGSRLARAIDRWIYVFMASWFMAITLVGFVPFTVARIAANRAGTKPPFPPILHVHAVVMSAFLLLLLIQAILMATGRRDRHQWLGRAAIVLVPAIVVVAIGRIRRAASGDERGGEQRRSQWTAPMRLFQNVCSISRSRGSRRPSR